MRRSLSALFALLFLSLGGGAAWASGPPAPDDSGDFEIFSDRDRRFLGAVSFATATGICSLTATVGNTASAARGVRPGAVWRWLGGACGVTNLLISLPAATNDGFEAIAIASAAVGAVALGSSIWGWSIPAADGLEVSIEPQLLTTGEGVAPGVGVRLFGF